MLEGNVFFGKVAKNLTNDCLAALQQPGGEYTVQAAVGNLIAHKILSVTDYSEGIVETRIEFLLYKRAGAKSPLPRPTRYVWVYTPYCQQAQLHLVSY